MARRAFLPTIPLPWVTTNSQGAPQTSPPSQREQRAEREGGAPPSLRPSLPPALVRASMALPAADSASQSSLSSQAGQSGPMGQASVESLPMYAAVQLLDRLAAADEAKFVVTWTEQFLNRRTRLDPALAVRLVRAYRETGHVNKARELAASLPSSPSSWNPLDIARLAVERATLCTMDGLTDHAESELRQASRALAAAARGTGLREQLDMHLTSAQLGLRRHRMAHAHAALRLAEHVAERLEDGAWRVAVSMNFGHLAMRLADPRTAAKHYGVALNRSPTGSVAAMRAHGNLAIALGSIGEFDAARASAERACHIAGEMAAGWRHADAYDVLGIVEITADRPSAALLALDLAHATLGDLEQATLRYQLAGHRTLALAMLGRAEEATQWLAKTEVLCDEIAPIDTLDDQDLVAMRARTLEACGSLREALAVAAVHAERLPDAFITGTLNLIIARCASALGDAQTSRAATERAALSGDKHGWVFPDREASTELWYNAQKSGDSRVVRYAEKMIAVLTTGAAPPNVAVSHPASVPLERSSFPPPPSRPSRTPSRPSGWSVTDLANADDLSEFDVRADRDALIYVTTPQGVCRVRATEVTGATAGANVIVDTIAHQLRVGGREVSLQRRRAIEPLVVQMLRRARDGLSAEEILRAAGGPGPESADAEHRVRVLISRVRDLLGDPLAIERVRDAGEHGRTRYRLSSAVRFALIEPLCPS